MKIKRLLSVLLCVTLCVGLLPAAVFAADNYGFRIYDSKNSTAVEVSSDNAADILGDGTISYDAATNTLTLNNCNLTSPYASTPGALVDSAIDVYTSKQSLKIELIGENMISGDRCIFVSGSLEINGSGSLNATGRTYGIYAGGDLTIDNASVTASTSTTTNPAISSARGAITIRNSNNVTSTSENSFGLLSDTSITIEGSTVTAISTSSMAYAGMRAYEGDIYITNSTVTANSDADAGISTNGNIIITNSTVNATTEFDDDEYGIYAIGGSKITISGGTVTATAAGKYSNAIYSWSSSIDITDGATVIAKAPNEGSYPAIFGNGGISVTDSNLTAEAGGDVAVYSPSDINIKNSIVNASAPDGVDGIMANGTSSVSGSWINTSGNDYYGNNIENSVVIKNNDGSVYGNAVISKDTELPSGVKLTIPEGTSLTVTSGAVFKNNGTIELIGTFNNQGGTVICADGSHAGGSGLQFDQNSHWNSCAICGSNMTVSPHNLVFVVDVYATDSFNGYGHYECTVCGYESGRVTTYPAQTEPDTPSDPDDTVIVDEEEIEIEDPIEGGFAQTELVVLR